jgi:hypothetical protein
MGERSKHGYVSCPRCTLRMRANIWQIFGDSPGECPRCAGLDQVEVGLVWADAARRVPAPPNVRTGAPAPALERRGDPA